MQHSTESCYPYKSGKEPEAVQAESVMPQEDRTLTLPVLLRKVYYCRESGQSGQSIFHCGSVNQFILKLCGTWLTQDLRGAALFLRDFPPGNHSPRHS